MIENTVFLFDLDGTLVDSRRDIALSVNHALSLFGRPPLPLEEVERYVGDGVRQLLARALGQAAPEDLARAVEIFLPHYLAHCADSTRLYPGVRETLEALAGTPLAVVTNKPLAHTEKTLRALGIERFFGAVLGGDSLPRRKPDPEPLLEAWRRLNGRAGTAWMVGDSPVDIRAGRAAGISVAAVTYGFRPIEELRAETPDLLLNSFDELIAKVR